MHTLYTRLSSSGLSDLENLNEYETQALDDLISFLSDARPFFETLSADVKTWPETGLNEHLVLVVCGNWYDLATDCCTIEPKVKVIASAAHTLENAEVLLTGGRCERLTPKHAELVGGEPLLLQQALVRHPYSLPAERIALYSGSKVTNHNLWAAVHYAQQVHAFTRQEVRLHFVEEAYLVKREACGLAAILSELRDSSFIAGVQFTAVGAQSFEELQRLHKDQSFIALALLIGEYDRLQRYTQAGIDVATQTHGSVSTRGAVLAGGAIDDLKPAVRSAIDNLKERHKQGLLKLGEDVLQKYPRDQMLALASPCCDQEEETEELSDCYCS